MAKRHQPNNNKKGQRSHNKELQYRYTILTLVASGANSQIRPNFQTQDRVKAEAEKGNPRPVRTAGAGKESPLKQIFLGRR